MPRAHHLLLALLALALLHLPTTGAAESAQAADQPARLAATPPMGWNSWNHFGCSVSAALIEQQADAMVSSGLKAAGYRYVVIDDCWQVARDARGNIVADPQRFPQGMKAVADYVHSKGLKFGLYSDAGNETCQHRPGSRGHETRDAQQYAAWGVDYVKYDWCSAMDLDPRTAYATMGKALRATGRPIVFSLCDWGMGQPWVWGAKAGGNLWRTTPDVWDGWSGKRGFSQGVVDIIDQQVDLARYAGPGHWNDPDMLEIGNGGMSDAQYRAQLSLWAIMAAPLIAGNDLAKMTPATRGILTNRDVIAVDQDPIGAQGQRAYKNGDAEIWVKPLSGDRKAVVLLNRGKQPLRIRLDWATLGLKDGQSVQLRDLWQHKDLPLATSGKTWTVAPTSIVMLTATPANALQNR